MSEEQVVDAAGESAVSIETPDHTPEVEIDSEAVVEETPATEEETQSVNESDDPLPEVIEDFSDLTNHLFHRLSRSTSCVSRKRNANGSRR